MEQNAKPDMQKNNGDISAAVINRLPRYYRCLRMLLNNDVLRINSNELADLMDMTPSQIRQDFNKFGCFGQQGYGYNVKVLYTNLNAILGIADNYSAVMIGSGNLAEVLAEDAVFAKRGVILRGVFDKINIGKEVAPELIVRDIDEIEGYLKHTRIDICVLTAYPEYAGTAAGAGVKGIWNLTGSALKDIDPAISVQDLNIGDSLITLCYHINLKQRENL